MATIEQQEKYIEEMDKAKTALIKTKWDFIIIGFGGLAALISRMTGQIDSMQFGMASLAFLLLVAIRSYYASKQREEIKRIREAGPDAL